MFLNAVLYVFAAIGLFVTVMWSVECFFLWRGKESPPRGLPRPTRYGWVMEPPARGACGSHSISHVQLGTSTPLLLLKLHALEYATLPKERRDDPEAQLPDDLCKYHGYITAKMFCRTMRAINYIRTQRGTSRLLFDSDMDLRLRLAIRQLEEAADRI